MIIVYFRNKVIEIKDIRHRHTAKLKFLTMSTYDTLSILYRHLYSSKVKGFPSHTYEASSILGKNKCALPLDTCIRP